MYSPFKGEKSSKQRIVYSSVMAAQEQLGDPAQEDLQVRGHLDDKNCPQNSGAGDNLSAFCTM